MQQKERNEETNLASPGVGQVYRVSEAADSK